MSVSELLSEVVRNTELDRESLYLVYRGQILDSHLSLSAYGFAENHSIYANVFRLSMIPERTDTSPELPPTGDVAQAAGERPPDAAHSQDTQLSGVLPSLTSPLRQVAHLLDHSSEPDTPPQSVLRRPPASERVFSQQIAQMMEMGFSDRDAIAGALRATDGNIEEALNLLLEQN